MVLKYMQKNVVLIFFGGGPHICCYWHDLNKATFLLETYLILGFCTGFACTI